jgi:hypothetical protein
MKRPDVERFRKNLTEDYDTPYYLVKRGQAVCDYALYLERRINDMKLGCEVDEIPNQFGGKL